MTLVIWTTVMRSFWSDPYLWIHLAGVAAVPIFLEICFLGLAIGDPVLPVPLEFLLIVAVGIAPILWMQWQRPFYIYSLIAFALKPEELTEQQCRILRLFKTPEIRLFSVITAIALVVVLWQIYQFSPIAADAALLLPQSRGIGLLIAAIAFLLGNLFLQVPVSVLRVLAVSETEFSALQPYSPEQVRKDFFRFGLPIRRMLPPLIAEQKVTTAPQSAGSPAIVTDELASPWDEDTGGDVIAPPEPVNTDIPADPLQPSLWDEVPPTEPTPIEEPTEAVQPDPESEVQQANDSSSEESPQETLNLQED